MSVCAREHVHVGVSVMAVDCCSKHVCVCVCVFVCCVFYVVWCVLCIMCCVVCDVCCVLGAVCCVCCVCVCVSCCVVGGGAGGRQTPCHIDFLFVTATMSPAFCNSWCCMPGHDKGSRELLKEGHGIVGCVLSACSCALCDGKTVTRLKCKARDDVCLLCVVCVHCGMCAVGVES